MIKILLLFITLFFSFNLRVDAALCDREYIEELKDLSDQVEISYEYIYDNDSDGDSEIAVNTYMITINLLSEELFVSYNNRNYYFSKNNNGIISFVVDSGDLMLSIHSRRCTDYRLKTVNINLPKFNVYSYKKECKQLKDLDLDVCNPWYQGVLTDEKFSDVINEFLNNSGEKNNISEIELFFKKYYIYIICFIAILIGLIFYIIHIRRRSVLQ